MEKTSEREKEIGAYGSEDQADEKPGLACRGHLGPVLSNVHKGQAEEQGREGREDQQNRREAAHRLVVPFNRRPVALPADLRRQTKHSESNISCAWVPREIPLTLLKSGAASLAPGNGFLQFVELADHRHI